MLKSKFIKALSLTSAILFTQTAWATPPSDELIAKYDKVTKSDQYLREDMSMGGKTQLKSTILSSVYLKHPDLTDQQKEQIEILFDDYAQLVTDALLENGYMEEEVTKLSNSTFKKYYTAEELQALIQFYETPIGQSILDKERLVSQHLAEELPKLHERAMITQYSMLEEKIAEPTILFNFRLNRIIEKGDSVPSKQQDSKPKSKNKK